MSEHVITAEADGILTLTLNRPEKKNALTKAMYRALADAIESADANPNTRCVLVQAEGDMFTAGNDLSDFASFDPKSEEHNPFILALGRARTPLVAAVNGRAVGIGLTLLLHCEAVYIAEGATLTAPFVNLALVPEAASSLLLQARIGYVRAFAVFALGKAIGADEAVALGIATATVPPGDVHATALAAARKIAALPAQSVRHTKTLMRDREHIEAKMLDELAVFAEQLQSPEAREAFAAFAEKRAPVFR